MLAVARRDERYPWLPLGFPGDVVHQVVLKDKVQCVRIEKYLHLDLNLVL